MSEFALYNIHRELEQRSRSMQDRGVRIFPLLASVQDEARLESILQAWRPDTIFHAAAYKHVPLVEHNPAEGIDNNVFGTLKLAKLAARHGVGDFVLISTDKAVRPTNIMGTSKRLAEMILQAINSAEAHTKFSMVRFGNVLGSSGSVVPLFREQIKKGWANNDYRPRDHTLLHDDRRSVATGDPSGRNGFGGRGVCARYG
jgi:FlaA1/EpsC-like NDP-sugar epimerase